MTEVVVNTRSIVVERNVAHSTEKIWWALTEGSLVAAWLMSGDFKAVIGYRFTFRADPNPNWNGVVEGEVLAVEPYQRLVYSWHTSGAAADGLRTVVTWTLTPMPTGSLIHMEQSGFRPQDEPNYQGAQFGWQRFAARLEQVLAELDE